MTASRIMFYCLVSAVMILGDAIWWRLADRRLRPLRHARLWRALLAAWVGAMAIYMVLLAAAPALIRRSATPIPVSFHSAVFLWHLFVLPALIAVELIHQTTSVSVRTILAALRSPSQSMPVTISSSAAPTRRQFLGGAVMALPPLVTGGLSSRALRQMNQPPRIRRLEIPLAQLPPHMDGMTIAHVTDIHVGKFTRPGSLNALAEQVNQLRSDFVVVTGDLIDMSLSDLPAALDMLDRIDPRQGIIVCEGNHDLYDSRQRFEHRTRAAGLPLLVDQACDIQFRGSPVQFLGLRWEEGKDERIADNFQTLVPMIRPDAFPILLAHHPHAFDPAAAAGIPLTLSGHTHGGQLMLTDQIGAGPLFFRYWSGLYRKQNSALVVSNGVGVWFPLRINAPAEVVHITLRALV
jgi:predicted MPP superfamily phosphohydrolase